MTTSRRPLGLYLLILSLFVPSMLLAQPAPPDPPTARELKEEQRIILNAYIIRGEQYLSKSREELADKRLNASKENGFHALELLARAKAKLNRHPERIEKIDEIFGTSKRKDLRDNLRDNIDPRYFSLQERLENVAGQLAAMGDNAMQNSMGDAKVGNVAGVVTAMRNSNVSVLGGAEGGSDSSGSSSGSGGSSGPSGGSNSGSGGMKTTIPNLGGSASQQGSDVTYIAPNGTSTSFPNSTLNGTTVTSPDYGVFDLNGGKKDANGDTVIQTSTGVLVVGKDGQRTFIPGGKVGPNGEIMLGGKQVDKNGSPIGGGGSSARGGNSSGGSSDVTKINGTKQGIFLDKDGNPITVDPDWENGEQRGTRRDYLGGKGARLVSETKVVRKIVQASGDKYTVSVEPGEARTWKLSIATGETRTVGGNVQMGLSLTDGGGLSDFTVKSWDAVSSSGAHASVTPSPDKPTEATATFSQDGDYDITVTGETNWGSAFRITGKSSVIR